MHSSWLLVQLWISWMICSLNCSLLFRHPGSQRCVRLWLRLMLSFIPVWLRPWGLLLFFSLWSWLNREILALGVLLWILLRFSLLILLWILPCWHTDFYFCFTFYCGNFWAWFIFCKFCYWDVIIGVSLFPWFLCISIQIWSCLMTYLWGCCWLITESGGNMATCNSH